MKTSLVLALVSTLIVTISGCASVPPKLDAPHLQKITADKFGYGLSQVHISDIHQNDAANTIYYLADTPKGRYACNIKTKRDVAGGVATAFGSEAFADASCQKQ
uniref:Lipoprotein n=1 Tax=mine drainage metagenome TaxID=410659 RepID=E6QXH3_9ZZZZ